MIARLSRALDMVCTGRVNECQSFSNTRCGASIQLIDRVHWPGKFEGGVYFPGLNRNKKGKQSFYRGINIYFFKLKIVLPNGAVVEYRIGRDWLYHIYVTPSIFDEDNVEGLCGNPNGRADDFIPQGSSFPTSNMSEFQASWRYNELIRKY